MTKHKIQMPDGTIMTSTVMSENEFTELLSFIETNGLSQSTEPFRKNKLVPLVYRGTKTAVLFDKYQIDTDHCSFCVRGFARDFLDKSNIVTVSKEDAEKAINAVYEALADEAKVEINSAADATLLLIDKGHTPESVFMRFINKANKDAPRQVRLSLADAMLNSLQITLMSYKSAFNEKEELRIAFRKYLIRLFAGSYIAITTKPEN